MGQSLKVAGVITLKIDGKQYPAKGNFTYNLGTPKREAVMGADGFHGFKETPQVAYVEGEITDRMDIDLKSFVETEDATILLQMANGKSVVFRNAYYAGDGNGETEEGKIGIRFEAPSGEEIK